MKCPGCGEKIAANAAFCPFCGVDVDITAVAKNRKITLLILRSVPGCFIRGDSLPANYPIFYLSAAEWAQ